MMAFVPEMQFVLGKPPDDPGFHPDPMLGWRKVRGLKPRTLLVVGSLLGVPLAMIIGFLWSRVALSPLTISLQTLGPGSRSPILLALIVVVSILTCLFLLVVVHEFTHVLAYPQFGMTSATVFGVWPSKLLPYASHLGPLSYGRLILVALAPLTVISVLPLVASYLGLVRSPVCAIFSILNSLACGGDVAICLALGWQLPLSGILQHKEGETWWRPAESANALESAVRPETHGDPSRPAP